MSITWNALSEQRLIRLTDGMIDSYFVYSSARSCTRGPRLPLPFRSMAGLCTCPLMSYPIIAHIIPFWQPYALALCLVSIFAIFIVELIAFRWGTAKLAKLGKHHGKPPCFSFLRTRLRHAIILVIILFHFDFSFLMIFSFFGFLLTANFLFYNNRCART